MRGGAILPEILHMALDDMGKAGPSLPEILRYSKFYGRIQYSNTPEEILRLAQDDICKEWWYPGYTRQSAFNLKKIATPFYLL